MKPAQEQMKVVMSDHYVVTWDGATRFHVIERLGAGLGNEVETFASSIPLPTWAEAGAFAAQWITERGLT